MFNQSFFRFNKNICCKILLVSRKIFIFVGRKDINFLNVIEMKQIYYLFMALVACAMFVACDTTQGGTETGGISDKDKKNATELVDFYDAYYSQLYLDGVSNDYWMSFLTEGVEMAEEGYPVGSGEFIYFEVFPETVENHFPAGEFTLAEEAQDGYAWAGWEYDYGVEYGEEEGLYVMPQGSYAYVIEDGELIETKYMISGYIKILGTASKAEVFADVTFDDGTKATYYYEGKLRFEDFDAEGGGGTGDNGDYTFDFEPTEVGEYEVTFDVCQALNNGNMYNTNSDNVELYLNGVEWLAYYDLFAPLNSGEDIYGTYTVVANKYDEWCAVPSSGGNEYGDTPSFFATDFTDDDYYNAAYYVVSGSVVIAKDGITIDAVSYNGSKIKGSYVGEVVVETGADQYVKSNESIVTTSSRRAKLVKVSAEDVVYVGSLKNRIRR